MDGKDVEEIFKDVMTDESQDSVLSRGNVANAVSSSTFPLNQANINVNSTIVNQQSVISQTPSALMSPSHSGNFVNL